MRIASNVALLWKNPRLLFYKIRNRFGRAFLSGVGRYVAMQKSTYELAATQSSYGDTITDHVVGSYDRHNEWRDYETHLMRCVDESFRSKLALDFGCGPGRNIIKYQGRFARIDGADISPKNLENARTNLKNRGISIPSLFVTNGTDLGAAPADSYDFIFSTITLQHICVHKIRCMIFAAMHRALKPGGRISIQMGFGADSPSTVGYYEDFYEALASNRACDTRVESPEQIRGDLETIGFEKFEAWIRPTGPGDLHPQWIFFTATKP